MPSASLNADACSMPIAEDQLASASRLRRVRAIQPAAARMINNGTTRSTGTSWTPRGPALSQPAAIS
jgi:hypothetical protein